MAEGARRAEERGIGHQQRRGGIVQQPEADQRGRLGGRGRRGGEEGLHLLPRLQQHQLERHLEPAALPRQGLAQREAPRPRVEAAHRPVQGAHLHAQAVAPAQALGDGMVHLRGRRRDLGADPLGRRFQDGEVVRAVLEEVPRLLVRQQHPAARGQGDARGVLPRDAQRAVQGEHAPRGGGGLDGQGPQLRLRHRPEAQHGVGQHLAQAALQLALRLARQGRQVHLQRVRQLEQQRGGDAALVVLDQVEVGGRDAQPGRQRLLRERLFLTQAADGLADPGGGHRRGMFRPWAVGVKRDASRPGPG